MAMSDEFPPLLMKSSDTAFGRIILEHQRPHILPGLQYPEIDASKEIRLLVLPPLETSGGARNQTFKLEVTKLESCSPYEVLSSVWGTNVGGTPVEIDGCQVEVAAKLVETLNSMRKLGRPRRVWVGTLCIDRNNHEERWAQGKLMIGIQAGAEAVIVPEQAGRQVLCNL